MNLLASPKIRAEINRAWLESNVRNAVTRREQGGYIVATEDGSYLVERWQPGELARITPPALQPGNRYNGRIVLAAFHTHPNPPMDELGREWEQAPSESDLRWHRRHRLIGFVIAEAAVYGITAAGDVSVIGARDEVL